MNGEMIRYKRWLLPFEVTVMFCLPGTTDEIHHKLNFPQFFVFRIVVQSVISTPARLL